MPALAVGFLVDVALHGERPLFDILQARGWAYVSLADWRPWGYRHRDRWLAALDPGSFVIATTPIKSCDKWSTIAGIRHA